MTVLIVVAILVFLIIAHEFGHFIAAKILDVRVDEFGLGYPPRAFRFGKIGETEYTLNWLPFGGFVRLWGEDGEGRVNKRSLEGTRKITQVVILLAGVTMNIVAAWLLFTVALSFGIPRVVDSTAAGKADLVVTRVIQGSPADASEIAEGDEIIDISTRAGLKPSAITPAGVSNFVNEHAGELLHVSYTRAGVPLETDVRPAHGVVETAAGRAALGIQLAFVSSEPMPIWHAAGTAFGKTGEAITSVAEGLWGLLVHALGGVADNTSVVGPVGLIGVVGQAAQHGVAYVLWLAAFISINLAIINILPLPALDGGRLAVLAIERIRGREVPDTVVSLLNTFGFLLIIVVMLAVTWNDIARLLV